MDTHKNLAEFLPVITDDEDDDILLNEPPLSNDEKVLLQRCDLIPSNTTTETTETTIKETAQAQTMTANDADGSKTPVVEVSGVGEVADVGDHTEAPVTKSAAVDAIKLPSYDPDDGVRISCKLVLPKEDRYDMSFNLHRMLHLLVEYMRGVAQFDVQVVKNLNTSCCGCLRDKLMCTHDDPHNTKVHDVVRIGNSIEGYVFLAMWRPGRVSRPKSRHGHSILVHVTNQDLCNDEEANWSDATRTLCWEGVSGQVPLAQVSDTLLLPNLSRLQLLILGCIAAMGIVCTEQGRCTNRKRIACVVQGYDDIQDVVVRIIQRVSGHNVTKNLFADDNDESSAPKRTSSKRKRNNDIETNNDEPVHECPPSSCVVPREKLQLLYSRLCTWKAWAERKLAQ